MQIIYDLFCEVTKRIIFAIQSKVLNNLYITFFIILSLFSYAQDGTKVYTFLTIPVSARQAALGGDAVSIRDYDPNFAAVNPALLNSDSHNQISLNAASFLAGSKYATINYSRDLQEGHLMTINARVMDYVKMPRTDDAGFQNGEFGAMDAMIGGGYAFQFEEEWTIGAQVNFITSKIDNYTSMAVSGNVGVAYHFRKTDETVGLAIRNFGYQFKPFNGNRENLPFRIDVGYTKILKKFPASVTITAHDLQQFNISSEYTNNGQKVKLPRKILDHFSLGVELFPEKAFNLRLGYNVKRGNELAVLDQRSFAGLSAGFGLKFSNVRFEYAHSRYHNAANLNQVGLTIDFSGNRY